MMKNEMNNETKNLIAKYSKLLYTPHVKPYPTEEGFWRLISTGEIVEAIEQDGMGYPVIALKIKDDEGYGIFYSVDFQKEIFVRLDEDKELMR